MKTILKNNSLFIEVMIFWGKEKQMDMLHEEIGEMMQALNKYKRNPNEETVDHLSEEVIDVEIMLAQIKTLLPERRLEDWELIKLNRLKSRLERAKKEREESKNKSLSMLNDKYGIFKVLSEKGLICTDGEIEEIIQAVQDYNSHKDIKVVDPEEVKE